MKTYKVIIQNEAVRDTIEARSWYNKQLKGLGIRFSKDIKITLLRIASAPYAYAIRYDQTRKADLSVFPYGVFFFIDEPTGTVYITAIKHHSRNTF